MVIAPELIGKNGTGIPRSILQVGFKGIVRGGSGRELLCHVDKQYVIVEDPASELHLNAVLYGDEIGYSLRTRRSEAHPHPDLHARVFFQEATRFLIDHNTSVRRLRGLWSPKNPQDRTNFDTFIEVLKQLKKDNPSLSEQERFLIAASQTWTAEQARKLGFSRVAEAFRTEDNAIKVFYEREE